VSSEVAHYIAKYGYLAVFLLVLVQELGVPNPVTNEFVLLFSGYLAFAGVLNLPLAILVAVLGDCIGTTILYATFYRFGRYIMAHRPRWFPLSQAEIDQLANTIAKRQRWGIYLARLIPFVRGYASVAAGLLPVRPTVFVPAVILSAITWSGGYVVAGRLLGPYWDKAAAHIGRIETLVLVGALLLAVTFIARIFLRKRGPAH